MLSLRYKVAVVVYFSLLFMLTYRKLFELVFLIFLFCVNACSSSVYVKLDFGSRLMKMNFE